MLFRYFKQVPKELHGVEGAPDLAARAVARGFKVTSFDLNSRWPYPDNKFDVVFSNQVIEHVHNCRLFAAEAFRVLKPGGTVVIATENLCSLLNWFAITLGYTPFSLMQTCGRYLGNPLGLHYNESLAEPLPAEAKGAARRPPAPGPDKKGPEALADLRPSAGAPLNSGRSRPLVAVPPTPQHPRRGDRITSG